jgi:peptidoglycan hydrolase-like protein with peptidoglycan-binding domain
MPRSAKPVDFDERFNPISEGVAALGGAVGRNPLAVGGTTAFLVAFSYVAANAVWYQPHFHRGAFFATRDIPVASLPADLANDTTIIKIEREGEPVPVDAPTAFVLADPVVERVQAVLSDLDFYAGDVDGLNGPNTRTAIEVYRKTVGLPVSGEIDDELLDHLGARQTTQGITPMPAPAPREEATARPVSIENPAAEASAAEASDPLVERIQAGLKAFGHETMEIDGIMGNKTRLAIKEFQALFGLPVTGEPDGALYAKMREIGLTN